MSINIAFIDVLGLPFDGSTLEKRGLGGSESAVIRVSRELVKLGLNVTVFNDCVTDDCLPGWYDGVCYRPLSEVDETIDFDVVIASRSLLPFSIVDERHNFRPYTDLPDFIKIQESSAHKVVWLHDTFADGENLLETFILQGRIDEIWTLSDWHTSYVTNCDHGIRRNFDVLKPHIFQTRNGIGAEPKSWIDVRAKDPNLYVFNASVTKGMIPLVENIWPRVKEQVPEAKLKVIGGYYRFSSNSEPDQQELDWRKLVEAHPEVEFTGIISQDEISDILTRASYMIYPAGFPETFGISTLEALAHNVPIITCDFGALGETAIDLASYKIPYPVEPNWALPWLNKDDQINRFVDMVIGAREPYLHQQKMYTCNQVKDICTWDTVALQWKQHLYKVTGNYLPVDEYRKVIKINNRVREVFGRTFINKVEQTYKQEKFERDIVIVTPVYNGQDYIRDCILSVAQQDYSQYCMVIVDDCSTDNTASVARETIASLPKNIRHKFHLFTNKERKGAVANQFKVVCDYYDDDVIYMLLDGDDSLVNDPTIFSRYTDIYHSGTFTYGSCWSMADNIPLIAQEYPPEVKANKTYRDYKFNWNMPYTHLRTFSSDLVVDLDEQPERWQVDGKFPMAGGDTVIFYDLIERVERPEHVIAVTDVVVRYNDKSPLNDYKINGAEQTYTATKVLSMNKEQKFSVVLPTMWRCPELTMTLLKDLVNIHLVDEILIIDNDRTRTPVEQLNSFKSNKIKIAQQEENIGVNPAWNLGIEQARNDLICIVNDDVLFDPEVFDKLQDRLFPGSGPYGIIDSNPDFGQPEATDYTIDFIQWKEGDCIHSFGQCFFIHKSDWITIPPELLINFGDDFLFHTQRFIKKNPIHLIYNIRIHSPKSVTINDPSVELVSPERFAQEQDYYVNQVHEPLLPMIKKILIAIPTARYIEPDTFKSIYDLEIPEGYEVNFQYFFGYEVAQIRNLIADWTIKGYDYLFSVDHDITFRPDTLKKLLSHDRDVVTGVYRQRRDEQILEITDHTFRNIPWSELKDQGLTEIGGCGFGCVLVKKHVFIEVGYPQFTYHSALDHKDTFSEDMDFCKKARNRGFTLWADPSVVCDHIGTRLFKVE